MQKYWGCICKEKKNGSTCSMSLVPWKEERLEGFKFRLAARRTGGKARRKNCVEVELSERISACFSKKFQAWQG